MKKIKTIITIMLAICLIFAFGACSQKQGSSDTAITSKAATKGTLVMATNAAFPPYEYYENEKIVGIDADIAAAIAEKLGMELKIEDMEFGSIITAVQTGKVDMGLAGMTVTEDRLISVDFSNTYATGHQVVIVQEGSDIVTPDDLEGKIVGVQESTTGDIYISDQYGDEAVQRYSKGADAVLALTQGKVDAVVIDLEPAKVFVKQNKGLKLLDTEYATEEYAIALAKNSPLLEKINAALAELEESGELKAVIDKYITAE
ncbi:MAG: transporter substrate-binding domain-containing protein [Christensenellales bacterium]|jgi:ABC-type amino acid transport substrate-binding protein